MGEKKPNLSNISLLPPPNLKGNTRKQKYQKKKCENDKEKKRSDFFSALPQFFFHLFSFAVIDEKKLHRHVIIYNMDALKLSIIFSDGAIVLIASPHIYYCNCNTKMGLTLTLYDVCPF